MDRLSTLTYLVKVGVMFITKNTPTFDGRF